MGSPKTRVSHMQDKCERASKDKKEGGKVSWRCVCGMVSEECSEMPSCVWKDTANLLNNIYWVDYPLPESPYRVTWGEKGLCERGN
ncbi:hypothetical protein JVT61DRAFT_1662 [Boletus reticuloceps]|uniref:Uncharacterized protein n=1 Tax=Boletus reticuloceps TaxID=495285 RepID=A0A8I2YRE1_9AGAM|nr:hypothetical protein JVT61DRAFT_1662 [Boletus reticuloceps]